MVYLCQSSDLWNTGCQVIDGLYTSYTSSVGWYSGVRAAMD